MKYKACMFSAYDFNSYLYVNVFLNGLALVPSVLVNVLCYYSILHKVILKKSFTDLGDNQLFDRSCFLLRPNAADCLLQDQFCWRIQHTGHTIEIGTVLTNM